MIGTNRTKIGLLAGALAIAGAGCCCWGGGHGGGGRHGARLEAPARAADPSLQRQPLDPGGIHRSGVTATPSPERH